MKIHVHDLRVFYAMVHKRVHGDLPELHKTKESRLASTTAAPRGPEAHCDRLIVISASERATFFRPRVAAYPRPGSKNKKALQSFDCSALHILGWLMGLEPTTTGITILDSTN